MSNVQDPPDSLISHLTELRTRLLLMIAVVFAIFIPLAYFAQEVYELVSTPLLSVLPEGNNMIAIGLITPFIAPFKLAFLLSIVIAIPYLLYQIWAFVAPGLYQHEKRLVAPLLISSTLLFYAGIAFAFFVVFPLALNFLVLIGPDSVQVTPDMAYYLDFLTSVMFGFGISFEIPVAIVILCWTGITNRAALAEQRRYIIVGVFVVAMLLTPPDVISQIMLAIPMLILFEFGLLLAVFYERPQDEDELNDSDSNTSI